MYSTDREWILEEAEHTSHLIFTEIDPSQGFQARRIALI
jgi:hypothetical protein